MRVYMWCNVLCKQVVDGTNGSLIVCPYCSSKILLKGDSTYIKKDVSTSKSTYFVSGMKLGKDLSTIDEFLSVKIYMLPSQRE